MSSPSTPIEEAFERDCALALDAALPFLVSHPATSLYYETCCRSGGSIVSSASELPRSRGALGSREWRGAGIQVYGEHGGYFCSDDLTPRGFRALLSDAGHALRGGSRVPGRSVPERQPARSLPADAPHRVWALEKESLLQEAADAALGSDDGVTAVKVTYLDETRLKLVASAEGIAADSDFRHALAVEVTIRRDGNVFTGRAFGGGAYPFGYYLRHPPAKLALRAADQARLLASAKPLERAGAMPVVFGPGWGGVWLHEAVGHLLEADVRGLVDWEIGDRVGPAFVSISDDPTLPGGRGSMAYDDEGNPAEPRRLIDRGVLVERLASRSAAGGQGSPRAGNGRRQDFRHPALPRMTNLVLHSTNEGAGMLLQNVRKGLYVNQPAGGAINPHKGIFHVDTAECHAIENGSVTHPVEPVRISGWVHDVLNGIRGVASDFGLETARGFCEKAGQVVPISIGQPTVAFGRLEVSPVPE